MKTKDLMIGDYVTFKDCQNNDAPTIVKIEGLGYQGRGVVEEALVSIDGDAAFDLVEINEEFVGIPLTPEILGKNGWMKVEADGVFYPKQLKGELPWIGYSTDGHSWIFRMRDFCEIEYVHELQHALKLCGIEKEIVL